MGKAEGVIESYLKKQAKANGFLCEKFIAGRNGVPDRILIGHKKVAFVETKKPGDKARPLQIAVHKEFREHGAIVYTVDTKEGVDQIIQELLPKRLRKKEE